MDEGIDGGCFCRRIRYRLKRKPMFVNCCHCTDCQRQVGSAFVVNGVIERENVELTAGDPIVVTLPTESGRPHDVYRCAECQTALWSDYGRRGWLAFLRIASLDRPSDFPPDAHIFTRSKVSWLSLQGGAPAFEIYYDMKTLWPAESLARREAAEAKAKT